MEPICIIKDIYKTLYAFEKTFTENNDITINEAMLLCCLKEGESKSAGTICEFIGLSNSRVSKVITAVENKGFIRRNINKNDKRQMFFSLTSKGKEKIQQMMEKELNFDFLFDQLQNCIQKE
ncbi:MULTISPECIES: winged helix DNA-binding protein [Parabacteroides]|uniref:winged helix DNA-binding protein n=1 Tax=Parabacteroides provencensis TaxID=1944636 RepID=UPI000C147256|nr:winged helix DNA-binding protein [Parabacteroides provencensis]